MGDSSSGAEWLVETNDGSFETDVMVRSQLGLVVVDFWAEWCGPCRALAPVLEKVIGEYEGRVTLVKANTDQAPSAAARFGVQGIPALFAVYDGRVLDTLQGAVPEETLRGWLDRQLQVVELERLEAMIEEDAAGAEQRLRKLLQNAPSDSRVKVLLLLALMKQDRVEEVRALLEELERRGFLEPEAERIKAELDLRAGAGADLNQLEQELAEHPEDSQRKLKLAEGLAAAGQFERALQLLLEIVEQDRRGAGETAKERMVEIFRVLGDDNELTGKYRRQLALALY